MKVLLCEDEKILLAAIEYHLRKENIEVISAMDGEEAMQKIRQERPTLIIADILMPKMTGLDLVHFVRKEMKSSLPILVISALEYDDIVLKAFQLGANDFIAKPFKPSELVLRVKLILQYIKEKSS
ncbi:MAG: response regulator [Bacteroidetes bacterium]|nr:response regulator [Bacteroidota bacterium]